MTNFYGYDPVKVHTFARLHNQGKYPDEIAALTGSTTSTVTVALSKYRTSGGYLKKLPSRRTKWTPEIVAEWRRLKQQRMSSKDIAALYDTSHHIVNQRLAAQIHGEI